LNIDCIFCIATGKSLKLNLISGWWNWIQIRCNFQNYRLKI